MDEIMPITSAIIITDIHHSRVTPETNSSVIRTTTRDIINPITPSVKNLIGSVMILNAPQIIRFTSPSINIKTSREEIPELRFTPGKYWSCNNI